MLDDGYHVPVNGNGMWYKRHGKKGEDKRCNRNRRRSSCGGWRRGDDEHRDPRGDVQCARSVLKDARDVSETKDPGPINTYHSWGRVKPIERLRVDYIYVSDGIRVRDFTTHNDKRPGTDLYPSDHYPLSATIELPCD